MKYKNIHSLLLALFFSIGLFSGCSIETPEQKIDRINSEYYASSQEDDGYADVENYDTSEPNYARYTEGNAAQNPAGGAASATSGQDQYYTDPVPEGKPAPTEPETVTVDTNRQYTCTLSVRCDTILANRQNLTPGKEGLVPDDGVIYPATSVPFYEGESVFDVLLREMQLNRIHMEYVMTPMYNSNYIEGINNLYEFDCGELSGWMYQVNGWYPNYGCSRYLVQDGDVIEWNYTCDLGRDLGQYWLEG